MKRKLFLILAVALAGITASARNTEVSVSYGASPAMSHIAAYHDHWSGMNNTWGAINATIDHRFSTHLWVGLSYTFSTADSDHAVDGRYGKVTWHGLMANAGYEWLSQSAFRLYSHVGVGALVEYYTPSWEDSYNRTHIGFQVSPIGIEADLTRNIGVFAEVGYGIQGIAKAGLRIGF